MPLTNVVGELGVGKTLTLAYLLWRNWFFKGQKIYSNIHLYKIPYIYIAGLNQLDNIRDGYVGLDELWLFADSRMSRTKRNLFVSNILAKSRKRHLTYVSTSQVADSLESRIRKVLDFTFYPILNREETVTKLLVFRGGYVKASLYMKTLYYKTQLMKMCYDTDEEVGMEEESSEHPMWVFQENFNREHGNFCECDKCGTKFFKKWEEAEKYASSYYKKHITSIKKMI